MFGGTFRNPRPRAREFVPRQSLLFQRGYEPHCIAGARHQPLIPLMMTLILWEQQAARND